MSTLFRPEAIDGQRQSWLGEVRLVRPLPLTLLTAFAVGVAALLVALLFVAEYTREAHLDGALAAAPAAGLQAMLYAPPALVGQLRPDLPVRLRYEAFAGAPGARPTSGRIAEVARTPAAPGECVGCGALEVRYRVTVALDAQSLVVDGREHPLASGMRVDADVLLDRRRLIDWVFEPAPRALPPSGA